MGAELIYDKPGTSRGGGPYVRPFEFRVNDITYHLRYTSQKNSDEKRSELLFVNYSIGSADHRFTHIPYDDTTFVWAAQKLAKHYAAWDITLYGVLIDGQAEPILLDGTKPMDTAEMTGPVWCVVANMRDEISYGPEGKESRHGSIHFAPGAKLYCLPRWFNNGALEVVGRHRGSHRYVTMLVRSRWLTHWRVELVYSPHVINELWPSWDGSERSKQLAADLADRYASGDTPLESMDNRARM